MARRTLETMRRLTRSKLRPLGLAVALARHGCRNGQSTPIALVKQIVASHDDCLWASLNPGLATVLQFTLRREQHHP